MNLPWSKKPDMALRAAQSAQTDASYAAQKAEDAFECARGTLKLAKQVLLLDALFCVFIAVIYIAWSRAAKNG